MDEPEEPEAVYIRSESDWESDRERRSESEVVYVGTYVRRVVIRSSTQCSKEGWDGRRHRSRPRRGSGGGT